MKIEAYSFGKITISGKTYTSDVIIYPDSVDPSWWREEGHVLSIKDLQAVLAAKPETLVVGTGYYGMMRVPGETKSFLLSSGIEVRIEQTSRAVELYNDLSGKNRNVIAALHLTC